MEPHDIVMAAKAWWLAAAAGPQLLFGFRMVSASMFGVAALVWLWNAASPNELEVTWGRAECSRFRVINWLMAAGTMSVAGYYTLAGMFEADRTSSPNRLLVGNAAFSLLGLAIIMLALAWRAHYFRKRVLWREQGKDVVVK